MFHENFIHIFGLLFKFILNTDGMGCSFTCNVCFMPASWLWKRSGPQGEATTLSSVLHSEHLKLTPGTCLYVWIKNIVRSQITCVMVVCHMYYTFNIHACTAQKVNTTYITNALNAYAGLPQGAVFLVMLQAKTVSGGPTSHITKHPMHTLLIFHI